MRRRAFIAALGGGAAWPLVARAQQRTMPVVGFLGPGSPALSDVVGAVRQGLRAAAARVVPHPIVPLRIADRSVQLSAGN